MADQIFTPSTRIAKLTYLSIGFDISASNLLGRGVGILTLIRSVARIFRTDRHVDFVVGGGRNWLRFNRVTRSIICTGAKLNDVINTTSRALIELTIVAIPD